MVLEVLPAPFSVCKAEKVDDAFPSPFFFLSKTDHEISLVCPTQDVPGNVTHREDGWRAFRFAGTLDFSLIGIISEVSRILADNHIGIFVVSTYDTDYVLVKADQFQEAMRLLQEKGYETR